MAVRHFQGRAARPFPGQFGALSLLATMSTTDPFKVAFNVSELDFLTFIDKDSPARRGDLTPDQRALAFELILADGRP